MINLSTKAGYNVIGAMVFMNLKYVPRVEWFDKNLKVKSLVSYE